MTVELSLILLLLISVGILIFLLFKRIKQEKRQTDLIRNLSVNELSEFMKKNSIDGSINAVARLFSDILKNTFRCKYIISLRKKRGILELNYYHGINAFNRNDFRLDYSAELKSVLQEDFFPRDISVLDKFFSSRFKNKIQHFKMDKFFPVFWKDNLYGFYVIKSNPTTNSSAFRIVIAQLAQSLAAAYHIKWHESKFEQLQERANSTKITAKVTEGDLQVDRILHFMKCKKTDAMIPQLLNSLSDVSQIENLIFVYDNKTHDAAEMLFAGKQPEHLISFKRKDLTTLSNMEELNTIVTLDEFTKIIKYDIPLLSQFQKNNINRLTSFPLSSQRNGILAWKQDGDSDEINKQVLLYKKYVTEIYENVSELESLEELSFTDNLTTLSNQRYFYKRLHEEMQRAERYKRNLALIIFDIDSLKHINDTYGHQAGDNIIRQVADLLKKTIRTIDVVARYGGDEFCIIMPETDIETCMKFVHRLHNKIIKTSYLLQEKGESVSCTISMGIAIYPDHAKDSKKLIYAADMALLKAKESGRNQALLASETAISE